MNLSDNKIPLVWIESIILAILGEKNHCIEKKFINFIENDLEGHFYDHINSSEILSEKLEYILKDIKLSKNQFNGYINKTLNSYLISNDLKLHINDLKKQKIDISKKKKEEDFFEKEIGIIFDFIKRKKQLGVEDLEYLLFNVFKNILYKNFVSIDKLIENVILEGIETFQSIGNIGVEFNKSELDILKGKFGVVKSSIDKNKIEFTIKYIKNHYKNGTNDATRNQILEKILDFDKRINFSKIDLLNNISNELNKNLDFKNLISKNKNNVKQNGKLILNIPLVDLNLREYFNKNNLNLFFDNINKIFSEIIINQIENNYKYKQVNLFFLGNLVNRFFTKENDFTNTLIDYNLSIKLSIILIQNYFLLKEYFTNVNMVFNVEKSLVQTDIDEEYFNDKNISGDYIVGYIVNSLLNGESGIFNSNHSYYNFIQTPKNNILTIANLKSNFNKNLNSNNNLKIFEIEKELEKEINKDIKNEKILLNTIYIGSLHKHFFHSGGYNIRYIPSFFEKLKFYGFILDDNGKEVEILEFNTQISSNKLIKNMLTFNINDIGYYSYINKTTIRNKIKENKIIIL